MKLGRKTIRGQDLRSRTQEDMAGFECYIYGQTSMFWTFNDTIDWIFLLATKHDSGYSFTFSNNTRKIFRYHCCNMQGLSTIGVNITYSIKTH